VVSYWSQWQCDDINNCRDYKYRYRVCEDNPLYPADQVDECPPWCDEDLYQELCVDLDCSKSEARA
jgi:hypothetical protein